jgi:hypothetical protein
MGRTLRRCHVLVNKIINNLGTGLTAAILARSDK